MLRECALLIADALRDPTTGLMATIPGVPSLPNDPDPLARDGVIHVLTEYEDETLARDMEPSKYPALCVYVDSPGDVSGKSDSGQVGSSLRLIVILYDRAEDLVRARATGAIIVRAARRVLNAYVSRANQEARTLNQIRIIKLDRMTEARFPDERRGRATVTGGLMAYLVAFDLEP